jgi:putative membrane protein
MARDHDRTFWGEAFAIRGSITPEVLPRVAAFGAIACVFVAIHHLWEDCFSVAPFEAAGAVLGLLLVLRINAGYERWWEARKLWGSIVNASRNLAVTALSQGPEDPGWRDRVVRWTAAFAHAARASLRGERALPEVAALLGDDAAARVAEADHMPSFVAGRIGDDLRAACDRLGMDRFVYLRLDAERAQLIEAIGGCERILKTPPPEVTSILIRRFVVLFLATIPLAQVHKIGWLTPIVTMLVSYPILALDQAGVELQNPFSTSHLSHLPLDEITRTIERNLLAQLDGGRAATPEGDGRPHAEAAGPRVAP